MKRIYFMLGSRKRAKPSVAQPAPAVAVATHKRVGLSLWEVIKKNRGLVLLFFTLLAGMVAGSVFARGADSGLLGRLDFLFASNFQMRAAQAWYETFAASLASSFMFVLTAVLLGLSLWGMVALPAVVFFRGFGLGLTGGFLYAGYGFQGVLFYLLVILPGAFLSSVTIVLCVREAMRFSSRLAAGGMRSESKNIGRRVDLADKLRLYLIRNGVLLIFLVAAALLDMLLTSLFAGAFVF